MSLATDRAQLIIEIDTAETLAYKQSSDRAKELRREIKKLEQGSEEYNEKMRELTQLSDKLRKADFSKLSKQQLINRRRELINLQRSVSQATFTERGFEKELQQVNSELRENAMRTRAAGKEVGVMRGAVAKIGPAIIAAFAVERIVSFTRELFNTQTELSAIENRFNTVFGESADLIRAWGDQNAISLGLTTGEFERAASAAGDLLKPMGFNEEAAARLSIELLTTSAALREFDGNNRTTEETTEILNKALLGEREQLKSLGVSIQEADVKRRLALKGQKNLTGEALKQAKALATLELIQESATDSVASFEAGTNMAAKSQAILQARTRQLVEDLGTKLRPVFASVLVFAEKVFRQFTEGADTTTTLGKTIDFVQKSFSFLGDLLGIVWDVGKGLFSTFVDIYNGSQLLRDGISFLLTPFKLIYTAVTESSAVVSAFQAAVDQMVDNVQQRLLRASNSFEIFKLKAQRALTFDDDAEAQLSARIQTLQDFNEQSAASGRSVAEAFNTAFEETVNNSTASVKPVDVELGDIITVGQIEPGGNGTTSGSGDNSGSGSGSRARQRVDPVASIDAIGTPDSVSSGITRDPVKTQAIVDSNLEAIEEGLDRELDLQEKQFLTQMLTEEEYQVAELQAKEDHLNRKLEVLAAAGLAETDTYRNTELEKLRATDERIKKEQEIIDRHEAFKKMMLQDGLGAASDAFSAMADLLGQDEKARKKNAAAIKAFQSAEIITNGILEVQRIWAGAAKLFPFGGVIAGIKTAISVARTAISLNKIQSQKFAQGGVAKFGRFRGPSHAAGGIKGLFSDGTRIEVEGDEVFTVLKKSASAKLRSLSNLNTSEGGRSFYASEGIALAAQTAIGRAPSTSPGALSGVPISTGRGDTADDSLRMEILQLIDSQRQLGTDIKEAMSNIQAKVSLLEIRSANNEYESAVDLARL